MTAAILITTRNRKEDLRKAIESSLAQTALVEILVIDDGSTDGTAQMVREQFPQVKLDRCEQSLGLIAQRSRGADLTDAAIIISIDDDCIFPSPHTVARTLEEFNHPRIGAVSIPLINMLQSPRILGMAPDDGHIYISSSYIGCAHALRRDLFIQLGRYRDFLWRQGEEGDYCIRLYNAGYVVRMGRADPIHHMAQPTDVRPAVQFYTARAGILFAWWNVPMPYLPIHLAGTTLNALRFTARQSSPWPGLKGIARGYLDCLRQFRQRRPVGGRTYLLRRKIKRMRPVRLDAVESELPPLRQIATMTASVDTQ